MGLIPVYSIFFAEQMGRSTKWFRTYAREKEKSCSSIVSSIAFFFFGGGGNDGGGRGGQQLTTKTDIARRKTFSDFDSMYQLLISMIYTSQSILRGTVGIRNLSFPSEKRNGHSGKDSHRTN